MIGEDDLASFFDPDEFGCTARLIEPDQEPRDVDGMIGAPATSGGMYRAGRDPNAATLRTKGQQLHLQIPARELPEAWSKAKVVLDGREYGIASAEPLGRLRTLLTLIPWADRSAPAGAQSKWQASRSI